MSHIDSRIQLVSTLRDTIRNLTLTDGSPSCISEDNVLVNTFKLIGRIGSGSINGEAFKLCYPIRCRNDGSCSCRKSSQHLAVKRVPIQDSYLMDLFKNPFSKIALKESLFVELLCLRLCNRLVEEKITPNLPLYVNYFICNNCVFENKELKSLDGSPCIILINELATEGDIKTWSESPRSPAEWYNAYFQIFNALYALQKYFNLTHHDLHWGNILVHKVPPGGFWRYVIDGHTYDVPNLGWLFVLWDFGVATIPGKAENVGYISHYREPYENPRLLADYKKITNIANWRESDDVVCFPLPEQVVLFLDGITSMYKNGATLKDVLRIFKYIYQKKSNNDILAEFSLDKPLRLEEPLSKFLSNTPVTSRRPSAEEVRFSFKFAKFQKNTVVPIRRKISKQLKTFSASEDFSTSTQLTAANYPPEPVTDISDPDDRVHLDNDVVIPLLEQTTKYQTLVPKFVEKLYKTLQFHFSSSKSNKGIITRATWARFIKWLILIDVPHDIVRSLAQPVKDYFANGILYISQNEKNAKARRERRLRRMTQQTKTEPVKKPAFNINPTLASQLQDELGEILSPSGEDILPREQAALIVNGVMRRIFSYLNQLDPKFTFDVNTIIRSPKEGLQVFACIFSYLPPQFTPTDIAHIIKVLEDSKKSRLVKLLKIVSVFIEMLKDQGGTETLLSLLTNLYNGEFQEPCGNI